MNIDLLSKMVKELILDNDKVILPGLGCFVAELEPASFSDKGFTINPPYRRMSFRSKPDEGNELIKFYAENNELEESVAEKIIIDFLIELKSVLQTKKVVIFPSLGRLRATKENNFFFVADEDLDIYEEGFALESVSLKSHQETQEEIAAQVSGLASILPSEEKDDDIPQQEEAEEKEQELEEQQQEEVKLEEIEQEQPKKELSSTTKSLIIIGIVILIIGLGLLIFALLAREYPHIIDQYLYTKEELEIINTIL